MKTAQFLFTLFIAGFTISAQEYKYVSFPDSIAAWSEYYWTSESPAVYNQYALFNEDTLINGRVYQKVFHTANHSSITRENSIYIGGIREDSLKRVFATGTIGGFITTQTTEILLYDFSLNKGDTIWRNLSDTLTANFTADYLVVKAIDTLMIQNSPRKVFSFYNYPWTRWIEGIGNIQGLFFPSGDLTTGGDNSDLICMHQNDTLIYFNEDYESCVPQFVIDNVALLPNHKIRVYPNPAAGGIVTFENLQFETLEIYDAFGRIIQKVDVTGLTSYKLNTSRLLPGQYSYRLLTTGRIPTKGRLVVKR